MAKGSLGVPSQNAHTDVPDASVTHSAPQRRHTVGDDMAKPWNGETLLDYPIGLPMPGKRSGIGGGEAVSILKVHYTPSKKLEIDGRGPFG